MKEPKTTVDHERNWCDGCAEVEVSPSQVVIVGSIEHWQHPVKVYHLCEKCIYKAEYRINAIFAFPLDNRLDINYYGEEPDEEGNRKPLSGSPEEESP